MSIHTGNVGTLVPSRLTLLSDTSEETPGYTVPGRQLRVGFGTR